MISVKTRLMGRRSYSTKTDVDYLKKVEIGFLKKYGYFKSSRFGIMSWSYDEPEKKNSIGIESSISDESEYIRFLYTQIDNSTGEHKDFDYQVPLTNTPCNFGGYRCWFICPMSKNGMYCGRRVGKLYIKNGLFACRHCYELTYESKKENRKYKLFSLFNVFHIRQKIDDLEKQIKRRYYAGKPTKKQRRLKELYLRANMSYMTYTQLKKQNLV